LGESEKHGYQIMQFVSNYTKGKVTMGPGSLYGTIDKLLKEKIITESKTEVVNGRNRKYYKLTGLGQQELKAEIKNLNNILNLANNLHLSVL